MKRKAFTVLELLIVTGLILLLSTLSVQSLQANRERARAKEASYLVVSALKEARELSFSTTKLSDGSIATRFGVYLRNNSRQVILFADKNKNRRYDGGIELLKRIELPQRARTVITRREAVVIFPSPLPFPILSAGGRSLNTFSFAVEYEGASKRYSTRININKAGLIYVEDIQER